MKEDFKSWWARERHTSNSPAARLNPDNIDGLAKRAASEGVEPDGYLAFAYKITKHHPAALIQPSLSRDEATASQLLAEANGEKLPPRPTPKPRGLRPHVNGRTVWDVKEQLKAELAAKEEMRRNKRNPYRKADVKDEDEVE